jgi:hypothetical protein
MPFIPFMRFIVAMGSHINTRKQKGIQNTTRNQNEMYKTTFQKDEADARKAEFERSGQPPPEGSRGAEPRIVGLPPQDEFHSPVRRVEPKPPCLPLALEVAVEAKPAKPWHERQPKRYPAVPSPRRTAPNPHWPLANEPGLSGSAAVALAAHSHAKTRSLATECGGTAQLRLLPAARLHWRSLD